MTWLSLWHERKPVRSIPAIDEPSLLQKTFGCDHDETKITQRIGTPDFDLFVAEGELEVGGNLRHGAYHLAGLLSVDPERADWLHLVERYIEKAGKGLDRLIPETETRHAEAEALRAYFWHAQGRLEEAVEHLIAVTQAVGDKRYLDAWVCGWIEELGVIEKLPSDLATMLFGHVVTKAPELRKASRTQSHMAHRWADLACRAFPQTRLSGVVVTFKAGALRKAGRFQEALATAGPLENSDEYQALARGLALRRLNRLEEAEQAFVRAIELKPGNVSAYLECGDAWFDANHWERALHWYEGALKLKPDQPWAAASALYCRWDQETGDAELDELFVLVERGNQRAWQIWEEHVAPFPEYDDEMAYSWREGRQRLLESQKEEPEEETFRISVELPKLEAPSNLLAMFLDCKAAGKSLEAYFKVDAIQTPDPRLPVAPVDYVLWQYEDCFPSPAVDLPRADVSACIEHLSGGRRALALKYADASFAANKLGVEAVPDLLAVMVHPPAVPAHTHALAWVPWVQLMAAFVLAQIDTGWEGSHRRKALLSMLFGPSDWITGAAIKALSRIAQTEQAYAMDIHEQFLRLEQHIPAMGGCSWYRVLYQEWGDLPFQTVAEKEHYQQRLG